MPRSDALGGPPLASRAVLGGGADNPLVRAVGRAPVTVRTKLLVAFAVIAALLVAVAVLGLRVLGQSNARVESLGTLQRRAGTYQSLQTQAQQLRQLLAIRVADDPSLNTDQLAAATRSQTDAVIAQNRSAYSSSRNLVVAVGIASVLLAVALGLVLSWSLIGAIQRTGARLAEIAAGDFSRHVEVPNRDELGELAQNLNRMNDELSRLYEELETVSRHKSEFLANMSHELRTPLNAIIGFSELLQMQIAGELNEQQRGYVDDVLESGQHLLALINDILDLSKVEAGAMELDLSDMSLRTTLESSLTMHA